MSRFKNEEKVVKSIHSAWLDSWIAIKAVMKVQTFQIIVMQGLVGSLPWMAMVFFTMWLELIGEMVFYLLFLANIIVLHC